MNSTTITYELVCKECKTYRHPEITFFESEEPILDISKKGMIKILNNFSEVRCETCNSNSDWVILKLQFGKSPEILKQFILHISKRDNELTMKNEKGIFSQAELYLTFKKITEKFQEYKSIGNFSKFRNANSFIVVDFLKYDDYREDWIEVSTFDTEGFSEDEIEACLDVFNRKFYQSKEMPDNL